MKHKIKTVAVYCGHQFGLNPAFVTDAELISGIITEKGICRYPYTESLAAQIGNER